MSSLFSRRHNLKIFYLKDFTKNSFNKQEILLLLLAKQFLDRGTNLPSHPTGINKV